MANLAGFIPQPGPGAIYGGNWSQDYSDVMNTLAEAQRAQQQNQFAHSPFGGSFLRRFGGAMPAGLAGGGGMQAPQGPAPDLAALQGALAQAIGNTPGTSITSPPFGDTIVNQATGSLQSQPWYDEFVDVAQAGGNTPVVRGNHMPLGQDQQQALDAGIQQRRQGRLGGTLPMADRRANVRNNAIAESEQRAVRMGDMSQNQQYFNELSRLQGALGGQQGGGGGNLMNGVLFGPEAMVGIDRNNAEREMTREKLAFAGSPEGWVAGAFSNGMPVPDVFGGQRAIQDPVGAAAARIAAMSPDRETFLNNAAALGIPLDVAQQKAAEMFPPKEPGFWSNLFGFGKEAIPRPAYTPPSQSGGAYPIPYG